VHLYVGKSKDWHGRVEDKPSNEGPARLFRGLVAGNLVRYVPETGRIAVADCDFLRRSDGSAAAHDEAWTWSARSSLRLDPVPSQNRRNLMTRLCRTGSGDTVLQEIDGWNRSGHVVAIRDTRPEPIGRSTPAWSIELADGTDPSLTVTPVPEAVPSIDVFSEAARWTHYRFGSWTMAEPIGAGRPMVFSTPVEPSRRIYVQVIGDIKDIKKDVRYKDGEGRILDDERTKTAIAAASAVRRAVRCPQPEPASVADEDAAATGGSGQPEFSMFSIEDPCGANTLPRRIVSANYRQPVFQPPIGLSTPPGAALIEIKVQPQRIMPKPLFRLGQVQKTDRPGEERLRKTYQVRQRIGSLVLRCRSAPSDTSIPRAGPSFRRVSQCWLDWDTLPRPPAAPETPEDTVAAAKATSSFTLKARNGTVLAQKGREVKDIAADPPWAMPEAHRLGIASWIGLSRRDRHALAAAAEAASRASNKDIELDLALDPDMQTAADTLLRELLTRRRPQSAHLPETDKYGVRVDVLRRAALVIVSAEQRSAGEILAAASWPRIDNENGLNWWNIQALDREARWLSPLASRAWADTDQLAQPGSTFKVVSALALIQAAADGNQEISRLLRGVPASELRRLFAVQRHSQKRSDGTVVDAADFVDLVRPVHNDGYTSLEAAERDFACPLASEFRGADERSGGGIGLRQALGTSSNIWFASMIARDNAFGRRTFEDPKTHPLARAIHDSFNHFAGHALPLVDPIRLETKRAARAEADRITAGFLDGGPLKLRLGRAAYGQDVQASPLAMATTLAAIALGRQVTPSLLRGGGRLGPSLIPSVNASRARALLNELHCGLRAVVSPGGTAYGAGRIENSELAGRLFAKTGTAQVAGTDLDTAWFAGWEEPPAGGDAKHGRIAFACMVSHADRGGGRVCAPIVAQLLLELHGLPSRAAAKPPVKKLGTRKPKTGKPAAGAKSKR
ncbi:MAG: penicillin-binding transpeptidase domain-containing protein, partial [Hyphomicrobiaceae bacterium]